MRSDHEYLLIQFQISNLFRSIPYLSCMYQASEKNSAVRQPAPKGKNRQKKNSPKIHHFKGSQIPSASGGGTFSWPDLCIHGIVCIILSMCEMNSGSPTHLFLLKVPAFEGSDGTLLTESNAIAYYVANDELRGGSDAATRAQVYNVWSQASYSVRRYWP